MNHDYPALEAHHIGSAELRKFHLSNEPQMVDILTEVPGYVAARRTLLDLHGRHQQLLDHPPTPVPATGILNEAIGKLLADGEPLPDDLTDLIPELTPVPVMEGHHRTVVPNDDGSPRFEQRLGIVIVTNGQDMLSHRVRGDALGWALEQIRGRLDEILIAHTAMVFARLTSELVDLVAQARKVLTDRGHIADADQAINDDRVEEYRHGVELGRRYAALRQLQRLWSSGVTETLPTAGSDGYRFYVANPLEVSTHLPRVLSGVPYVKVAHEREFAKIAGTASPWPSDWADSRSIWWFAAHPDAEPWAPTQEQARLLGRGIEAAVREHRRNRVESDNRFAKKHHLAKVGR